ncbi:MAG: DUF2218 domain-containing protein [Thermomicrobiales bacterium]|nr:DUF2218 domain-containing protein [Thermomicrobiales bacterium]
MTDKTTSAEFEAYPHRVSGELVHNRAARYAKQLISHWRNDSMEVDEATNTTTVSFSQLPPDWVSATRFEVEDGRAVFTVAAPTAENAQRVAESVEEHILGFAGDRDVLEFTWNAPE